MCAYGALALYIAGMTVLTREELVRPPMQLGLNPYESMAVRVLPSVRSSLPRHQNAIWGLGEGRSMMHEGLDRTVREV
jgi:hypothetical protein